MKKLFIAALLLTGCAGRVPGTAVWTELPGKTPQQWEYGFAVGPLLGRAVQLPDGTWAGYGCNNKSTVQPTLEAAQQFVDTSCANANKAKR